MRAARTRGPGRGICNLLWKSLQVKLKSVEDGTVTVLKDLFKKRLSSPHPRLTSSHSQRALNETPTFSNTMQKMHVADVN